MSVWPRVIAVAGISASLLAGVLALVTMSANLRLFGVAPPLLGIWLGSHAAVLMLASLALLRYGVALARAATTLDPFATDVAMRQRRTFWLVILVALVIELMLDAQVISTVRTRPADEGARLRIIARRNVAVVRSIGEALEAYARDQHGYPPAVQHDSLRPYLVPRYLDNLPATDEWGRPFKFDADCREGFCWAYAVMSLGRDGLAEPLRDPQILGTEPIDKASEAMRPVSFDPALDRDVIFATGRMLREPIE